MSLFFSSSLSTYIVVPSHLCRWRIALNVADQLEIVALPQSVQDVTISQTSDNYWSICFFFVIEEIALLFITVLDFATNI